MAGECRSQPECPRWFCYYGNGLILPVPGPRDMPWNLCPGIRVSGVDNLRGPGRWHPGAVMQTLPSLNLTETRV